MFIANAPSSLPGNTSSESLARQLEGLISHRAGGRIREIQVICLSDRIVIQGRSRTHYAKQLAQEAAMDLTGGHPSLVNEIVVH